VTVGDGVEPAPTPDLVRHSGDDDERDRGEPHSAILMLRSEDPATKTYGT
jgi:hypothetical protein